MLPIGTVEYSLSSIAYKLCEIPQNERYQWERHNKNVLNMHPKKFLWGRTSNLYRQPI